MWPLVITKHNKSCWPLNAPNRICLDKLANYVDQHGLWNHKTKLDNAHSVSYCGAADQLEPRCTSTGRIVPHRNCTHTHTHIERVPHSVQVFSLMAHLHWLSRESSRECLVFILSICPNSSRLTVYTDLRIDLQFLANTDIKNVKFLLFMSAP